jgi:type IV secretion system protein VirB10
MQADENKPLIEKIEVAQSASSKASSSNNAKEYAGQEDKEEKFSQVSASTRNRNLMLAGILIVSISAVYYILFSAPSADKNKKTEQVLQQSRSPEELLKKAQPVTQVNEPLVQVQAQQPTLPSLPELSVPKPPEPPPAPTPMQPPTPVFPQLGGTATPTTTSSGIVEIPVYSQGSVADQEELKKKDERRKSSSLVLGGGGLVGNATSSGGSGFLGFGISSNGSAATSSFSASNATKVSATYMTALDRTIAQGKLIHAVLETAINTDVVGMARAIISRDVYGESGKNILIPKGSRVIGEYAKEQIKDGQTRIAVNWKRLIRPDGIDIMLESPGTDTLGRGGIEGSLDTKFWTRLGSAFLVSYVVPVLANQLSKSYPDSLGTSSGSGAGSNATTTTTTTGSAGTSTTTQKSQFQQATEDFQEIAKDVVSKTFSAEPTIRVPQGERINIFVSRDLIFPSEAQLQSIRNQQ